VPTVTNALCNLPLSQDSGVSKTKDYTKMEIQYVYAADAAEAARSASATTKAGFSLNWRLSNLYTTPSTDRRGSQKDDGPGNEH